MQIALSNYFESLKGKFKGNRIGFPTKKRKSGSKWSYTTYNSQGPKDHKDGTIRINNDKIRLPKVGWVDIILHRMFPKGSIIKSVVIIKERDGSWYASILIEFEQVNKIKNINSKKELKVVGLDMSYKDFVVSSDKSECARTKYVQVYRKNEKRRSRLNRRYDKCEKVEHTNNPKQKINSKNREKARLKLAKLDRYIANYRKDYCHKISRWFVEHYDVIVLEDINLQNISKGICGGKSAYDLGFGVFKDFLNYKSKETDTLIFKAPRFYPSSKTCNHCGYIYKDLKLKDREWVCCECGVIVDRDYNAACNL